ncbi:MAG: M50 family metallopeptidase [Clostridia bacterium]|nr:M50 family metallopeptidase [Clostridia bacterium]
MELGSIGRVRLRVSFWILPFIVLAVWLGDAAVILLGCLCITVHELAHAAMAYWVGLGVAEIELMPFGGVARLNSTVARGPGAELAVALAGPVVSFICAFGLSYFDRQNLLGGSWISALIRANVQLALFNLLPALPLDGGRVLRALLSRPMGALRATKFAANIGIVLGIAMVALGVLGIARGIWNITLLACGMFLGLAAWREGREAAFILGRTITLNKRHLSRGPVRVRTLAASGHSPLREVARGMVPGEYHTVAVLDDNLKTLGLLDEGTLVAALGTTPANATLEEALRGK